MARYFVVVDRDRDGQFVAGFGDENLALAFATTEAARGRRLGVSEPRTGEVLFEGPGEDPSVEPPRASLTRLRRALEAEEE